MKFVHVELGPECAQALQRGDARDAESPLFDLSSSWKATNSSEHPLQESSWPHVQSPGKVACRPVSLVLVLDLDLDDDDDDDGGGDDDDDDCHLLLFLIAMLSVAIKLIPNWPLYDVSLRCVSRCCGVTDWETTWRNGSGYIQRWATGHAWHDASKPAMGVILLLVGWNHWNPRGSRFCCKSWVNLMMFVCLISTGNCRRFLVLHMFF